MKKKIKKYLTFSIVLILASLFVVKFAGHAILRLYIEIGIGDCRKVPIFCMQPEREVISASPDPAYLQELVPYKFEQMQLLLPKGFNVVQELIKKPFYKKYKKQNQPTIYLIYEPPGFFPNLYPQVKKEGVKDNYDFIKSTMRARLADIRGINSAFFVVMKGVITPDLGDQKGVRMLEFSLPYRRGFVNYNLTDQGNYFDCNLITQEDKLFKIYIKDTKKTLGLEKIYTIASTAQSVE